MYDHNDNFDFVCAGHSAADLSDGWVGELLDDVLNGRVDVVGDCVWEDDASDDDGADDFESCFGDPEDALDWIFEEAD